MKRQVRIGCYSRQLVEAEDAQLDYLVADYLAGDHGPPRPRLQRPSPAGLHQKAPGYIKEFATFVLEPLLPQILQKKIKVVTNAGGLDPVRVAAVYGDNIVARKDELLREGAFSAFNPLNAGAGDEEMLGAAGEHAILSLNAYTGAEPVTKALQAGANIVVTGRCVDSALVLGPLAHEYGWDYARLGDQATLDRLAAASLAGHIVECGAQATGGNFTDWELSAGSPHGGWANMGYPIVAFEEDGKFTVTKPRATGGLVTRHTVGEQMLYEVLDPENYILPDVVVDLARVTLEQVAEDVVRVAGGFRVNADMMLFGARAADKGKVLGEAILQRARAVAEAELRAAGKTEDFVGFESKVIVVGAEHSLSPAAATDAAARSREVVVRIVAKHVRRHVLDVLAREVASFGTSSAPGIGMFSSGRPKISPNFLASSVLIRRGFTRGCRAVVPAASARGLASSPEVRRKTVLTGHGTRCSLLDLAVGRSGDKGDTSNVAFISRNPAFYPYILDQVTPEVVASTLGELLQPDSAVTRYEVPGVNAVNFVLTRSLGGGGLDSMALDRQGKGYAQLCLASIELDIPLEVLNQARL
ncbi:unnamed protein product [Parascedosporium putredinis]|uniref:DUF1446-domain-containing protein n=1 Tax=Parascedosporium putredinis TaxID=1442378 RepID=A0A9P1GX84_9PEZI|nr:unnamed protein product [Parascedosporium putredinis]CAI7989553.1 unnamed protein product [Parascedosporium putredinis]